MKQYLRFVAALASAFVLFAAVHAVSSAAAAAGPMISTTATPSATLGSSISDTATLTNFSLAAPPTGTVTFDLFGPNDSSCSNGSVFTSTVPVTASGTARSDSFSPVLPGTYRWIAAYSGDANNAPASGACNDPGELSNTKASPTIATQASVAETLGASISDTATLSGGSMPSGTVSFNLFGPDDANCQRAPVFTSTVSAVSGEASSASFTPTQPGDYHWTASYNGDGFNNAASDPCNSPNETSTIQDPTGTPPFCDVAPTSSYTDRAEANVHARNVDCITWYGIAVGFTDNTYRPALSVSRPQMASFLARLLTKAGVALPSSPPDAFTGDNGGVHELAINQIAAVGVLDGTTGEEGDTYGVAQPMRRDDMAKLLYNSYEVINGAPLPAGNDAFTDDTDGGDPHGSGTDDEDAINALAKAGVVKGTGGGLYNPIGSVTRGQFASFFTRLMQILVDNEKLPRTP